MYSMQELSQIMQRAESRKLVKDFVAEQFEGTPEFYDPYRWW